MTAVRQGESLSPATADVDFTLDGQTVSARPGETLLLVAQRLGIDVPHLCAVPGLAPAGNCDEVLSSAPEGLTVVPVRTLAQARGVLDGTIPAPRCPTS